MRLKMIFLSAPLMALVCIAAPSLAQENDTSIRRAAEQPLRDTKIKQDKIPEILQLAASAPYSSANTKSCSAIAGEIQKLTAALGPDVDTPAKKKGEASVIAAAAARGVVNAFIPGLGLVRVLTGADKAQRRAEAAVYAGTVRRGYLKGLGLSKRCSSPAAPRASAVDDQPELPREDEKD